jgi:hypothetical protein
MTVQELIEKLTQLPPHLEVRMYTSGDAAAGAYEADVVGAVDNSTEHSGYVVLYSS